MKRITSFILIICLLLASTGISYGQAIEEHSKDSKDALQGVVDGLKNGLDTLVAVL